MGAEKEFKKIRRDAEEQGWTIKRTKKGHWQLYAPDGVNIVTVAGTPSDSRALGNTLARMRRYGFKEKGR